MELKNVAIVGPGGNVGSAIITHLLSNPNDFTITAIIRPTSTYTSPSPSISTITADFTSPTSLVFALQHQDAVLCCVGGTQTHLAPQKLLIDAAIAAGVKLFFASEYSGNITSPHYAVLPKQFVGEKLEVRAYLEDRAREGKIAWTALNTGPMFDLWLRLGVAGFDIANRKATIYGTGNCLSCWTPLPVIATAVVNMLRNPEKIANRGIFISGVRDLTQNTILAALEAELGEEFKREYVDVKEIKRVALEDLKMGEWKKATRGLTISSNFDEDDSASNFWNKVENELVGVQAVGVREAVREVLEGMRKRGTRDVKLNEMKKKLL